MATTVDIGTANSVWLGPLTNIGVKSGEFFAVKHSVAEYIDSYRDEGSITDVYYLGADKAMLLQPDFSSVIQDMRLTDFVLTGEWLESGRIGYGGTHLQARSCAAGVTVTATRKDKFTENPSFVVSFVRTELPPDTQTFLNQAWMFKIDHLDVSWGGDAYIDITYRNRADVDKAKQVRIADNKARQFLTSEKMLWEVYWIGGGEVMLVCNEVSDEPIILTDVKTIAASQFYIRGVTGAWGFGVSQIRFAKTGSFQTPAIECGAEYNPASMYYALYGPGSYRTVFDGRSPAYWSQDQKTSARVICSAVSGEPTQKVFTIQLAGDGYHTPYLQFWQGYWLPSTTQPAKTWVNISGLLDMDTLEYSEQDDSNPSRLSFTLQDYDGALQAYLTAQGHPELIQGQIAVACELGTVTRTVDGETTTEATLLMPQFVGVMTLERDEEELSGKQQFSYTAEGVLSQLQEKELVNFPCMLGSAIDTAIRWALWSGGVPDGAIVFNYTPRSGEALDDPGRQYSNPPWNPPDGTKAADFLRSILALGYRVAERPTGMGTAISPVVEVFRDEDPSTVSASFTEDKTGVTFRDVSAEAQFGEVYSHVLIRGKDADGKELSAQRPVPGVSTTPGESGYAGPENIHRLSRPDYMTMATIMRALAKEVRARRLPPRTGELETIHPDAVFLETGTRVTVTRNSGRHMITGYDGDTAVPFLVKSLTKKGGHARNTVTATLEGLT